MSNRWSIYHAGGSGFPRGSEPFTGQEILLENKSVEDLEALRDRLKLQYEKIRDKLHELISQKYNEIVDVSQLLNSSEYFQPLRAGLSLLKSAVERPLVSDFGPHRTGEFSEDSGIVFKSYTFLINFTTLLRFISNLYIYTFRNLRGRGRFETETALRFTSPDLYCARRARDIPSRSLDGYIECVCK